MTFKQTLKPVKKTLKGLTKREQLFKLIIIISTLALLATSILPYLLI